MAIRKYGLDEAEIEHLRAAHCTDEEINDLNKARVQEQMQEETEGDGEGGEGPEEISDPDEFRKLTDDAIEAGYLGIDKFGEATNDPSKVDSVGPGVRAALDALDTKGISTMAIRKYGLDEAEIEHLRAAHCTDEEINDLNKARVQEQMQEEAEGSEGGEDDEIPFSKIVDSDDFKRIQRIMPDAHPAYIGFIITSPYSIISRFNDEWLKNHYNNLKADIQDGSSKLDKTNKALEEAFRRCDIDWLYANKVDPYDYSELGLNGVLDDIEDYMKAEEKGDNEAGEKTDKLLALSAAQEFSRNFLPVDREAMEAYYKRQ